MLSQEDRKGFLRLLVCFFVWWVDRPVERTYGRPDYTCCFENNVWDLDCVWAPFLLAPKGNVSFRILRKAHTST